MHISRICLFAVLLALASCVGNQRKIGTYNEVKEELKQTALEKTVPVANPSEFEAAVNNGGLNQYFFNSSGRNCFATLRYFQKNGDTARAKILEEAIGLINPGKLSEDDLLEKLRKREVTELDDSVISRKLNDLDNKFYGL